MGFSKEIQGLRALAVLAVIFAHLEISWLPGGFVGVDVFFVISGYLITGLLLREYQRTGGISLSNFYRRRIRRLFPAMLVTCMFTLAGGFLLFSDERFGLLLDSALAAFF
ncbi:acyltransferase family protein [Pseudomonas aegrilactucae]|nr:acyltransferase [Pseudomonas aegrilactucae]MBV6285949.1 acyltransferase [Pseudomonas aegrilactucae]